MIYYPLLIWFWNKRHRSILSLICIIDEDKPMTGWMMKDKWRMIKYEWRMMTDERWMMKDEGFKLLVEGFCWQTDGLTKGCLPKKKDHMEGHCPN